ncbi:hypothetical protein JCM16408A_12250 [Methylobacterium phyllosphaerae]
MRWRARIRQPKNSPARETATAGVHGRWDSCAVLSRKTARLKCFQQETAGGCGVAALDEGADPAPGLRNLARIAGSTGQAEHKRHAGQRPRRHGRGPGPPARTMPEPDTLPGLQTENAQE